MFKLFKSQTIYVRLHRNKIEVKNVDTGKYIARKAIHNFSNDRLLIANFLKAEEFLRALITEVSNSKSYLNPPLKMLLQPVDDFIKEISPVEERTYLDSSEHAGAKFVLIYDKQEKLTDSQVLEIISNL